MNTAQIITKKLKQLTKRKLIYHKLLKDIFSQKQLDIIFIKFTIFKKEEVAELTALFKKNNIKSRRKIHQQLKRNYGCFCSGYYDCFIGVEINTDTYLDRLEIIDIETETPMTKQEFIERYNKYYNTKI